MPRCISYIRMNEGRNIIAISRKRGVSLDGEDIEFDCKKGVIVGLRYQSVKPRSRLPTMIDLHRPDL